MHIREKHIYTFDDFCRSLKTAFQNSSLITVVPVFAIMNYKEYYDQFIDKHLVDKYSKLEFTQLYFKVQPIRAIDLANNHYNLLVRTNYKKFGQEFTVMLRHNDFIDGAATNMPFTPIVLKSDWMPENAKDSDCPFPQPCQFNCYCKERGAGISFLCIIPHGIPKPLAIDVGSHANVTKFLDKVNDYFGKRNETTVLKYWQQFYADFLPESDNVNEYVMNKCDIEQPLAEYLYGNLNFSPQILIEEESNINFIDSATGFSEHRIRASMFDINLMDHIAQDKQSIPWRGHRTTAKNWEFTKEFVLTRVVLTRGNGLNRRTQEGTVVAWCGADANDGPLFQVVFDDRTAPTTLTSIEYQQCRAAYLERHLDEQTLVQEAIQRRTNENRARIERSGRTGRGRGRTPHPIEVPSVVPSSTTSVSSSTPTSHATSSSTTNIPQRPFQGQGGSTHQQWRQQKSHTSSMITPTLSANVTVSSTLSLEETVLVPPSTIEPPLHSQEPTSSSSTSLLLIDSSAASTLIHTAEINTTTLEVAESVVPGEDTSLRTLSAVITTTSGRRSKRKNFDDELCLCGCNKEYNATCMANCRGLRCSNRVNRSCVSSTWKCLECGKVI